jgi:hypothetical protein
MLGMLRLPFSRILNLRAEPPRARTRRAPAGPSQEQRAEALLLRHLTPQQRRTYLHSGWFEVRGRDGSRWTIYRDGGSQNVKRTGRERTHVYCSYLDDVPRADMLLVQKMCIEAAGGRGLPRLCGDTLCDEHLFG